MRTLTMALLVVLSVGCEAPVPLEQTDNQGALEPVLGLHREHLRQRLESGTYRFTLCYPLCSDSSSHVGSGILVVGLGSIGTPFHIWPQQDIARQSVFLLLSKGDRLPPNACFRVSGRRLVAGREYYPGIIPAGLTSIQSDSTGQITIGLYRSPDASFYALVYSDRPGHFSGIGEQHDWNMSDHRAFGTIEGTRVGNQDPAACFGG